MAWYPWDHPSWCPFWLLFISGSVISVLILWIVYASLNAYALR